MGKTANLELNTTEMSDKISDFVGEYNSNMNMLDDLYGDVQDDASSALSTAQSAETKATAAQTAATNAVTTANSANTTAQSAVSTANSANTTAGQANTKADNAVATANTAKTTADEAKETAETASADVADKADVDGTYDSFTAGGAKQLLSTVYVDDNEPYNFRTAGGSADIGDRMYEEVVGGSIVWNQIAQNYQTTEYGGIKRERVGTTLSEGLRVYGTATASTNFTVVNNATGFVNGHVYYFTLGDVTLPVGARVNVAASGDRSTATVNPITYQSGFGIYILSGTEIDVVVYPQVVDLTQMFGSTIADYIYSLEQGTAGAGVAWFRNLFPKPYYAYNAGELMSVKAGSHDTVGFNAWDEEWELGLYQSGGKSGSNNYMRCKNLIPVIEGQTYRIERPCRDAYTWGYADKNYSNGVSISEKSNGNIEIPTGVHYLGFSVSVSKYGSSTYKNDMCVHLVWDGERNGEYEPYEKHEYPLANIELRGIPKLDANNQLYYDGDTYASDGTVTRRYGIMTLAPNRTWNYSELNDKRRVWTSDPSFAKFTRNIIGNYIEGDQGAQLGAYPDVFKAYTNNIATPSLLIGVPSTITSVDDWKTYITNNPLTIIYELAEPTTETADSFVSPQIVNDFGTEEYTDFAVEAGDRDVAIPVGHNSQYMNNLRAKLEMAPDSPDGDGEYIVQQSNGENAYIPYTADGRLDAIEAKLPAPPSENGTYKLTATVSNNGVTYSWQS